MATAIAGLSGSYRIARDRVTLPVKTAARQKRQLGLGIWSLAAAPMGNNHQVWNGVDTTALSPHLVAGHIVSALTARAI